MKVRRERPAPHLHAALRPVTVFSFLTMVVSPEAIFLSIFVLVSQNRQATKDRLRADAEYGR